MTDAVRGFDKPRDTEAVDVAAKSALEEGREIFGKNLMDTRLRHPVYKTQTALAREMHALGYHGYATGLGDQAVVVAKKISKFERGVISPALPEAAALARILNTTLDALSDPRGTVDTLYEVAREAWSRHEDAVVSFFTAFHRANTAIVDFRNAQEGLRAARIPLFVPAGMPIWNGLWGSLENEERAQLVESWNKYFEQVQQLRHDEARRQERADSRLFRRLAEAEAKLSGSDLERSRTQIQRSWSRFENAARRSRERHPDAQAYMATLLNENFSQVKKQASQNLSPEHTGSDADNDEKSQ